MSESDVALQKFLKSYQRLLDKLRSLADDGGIAPAAVGTALMRSPLKLPVILAGVTGSETIARNLTDLQAKRKDTGVAIPVLHERMRELIDLVFTVDNDTSARPTRGATRRGNTRSGGTRYGSPSEHQPYKATGSRAMPPMAMVEVPESAIIAPSMPQLRAVQHDRSAPNSAAATNTTPPTTRLLSAEIDDHDKDEPLELSETYEIAFSVDEGKRENAIGAAVLVEEVVFPSGVDQVELTVDVQGEDFDIKMLKQTVLLKRTGKSRTKARFEITPKREGRCTLTAIVHVDRNFVQSMTIEVSVGAHDARPAVTKSESRSPSAAARIRPRDVMLVITPAVPSGYDIMARDARGIKTAHLEVEPAEMSAAITAARDHLLEVVKLVNTAGDDIFQSQIAIAEVDRKAALRIMARAGATLYRLLFGHAGGSADAAAIGKWLRDLTAADATALSIQIMSKRAPIPWAMLYLGDVTNDSKLDWRNFLGFRHIIEQLPIINTLSTGEAAIKSDDPNLQVSINLNRTIDREMRKPFVKDQEQFWTTTAANHPRVTVTSRTNVQDFIAALASNTTPDQILYFFGHAATNAIDAAGGVGASTLSLTDDRVTLDDLNLLAPPEINLPGSPLVFINACESAEMSPQFYAGFVTYFMSKGARGVIGTECQTPGVFAAEWAARFFKRFLAGESLGALVLALRQEFLENDGNPLGLLYAVHCDGDVQISPGI